MVKKVLLFIKSNFSIFPFMDSAFGVRTLPSFRSQRISFMFFSKSFIVYILH